MALTAAALGVDSIVGAGQAPSQGRTASQRPPTRAFEVASIRPSGPPAAINGAVPARTGGNPPGGNGCGGPGFTQVDAGRFVISNITLQNLITRAYSAWTTPRGGCAGVGNSRVLLGGADWVRTDEWDIEAVLPPGSPGYNTSAFLNGNAPVLEEMLQALLADRFKLVLRSEMQERPVYLLTVGKGGPRFNGPDPARKGIVGFQDDSGKRLTAEEVHGASRTRRSQDENGRPFAVLEVWNMSMPKFASSLLFGLDGRAVLDRTGLAGEFNFRVESDRNGIARPTQRGALEQIGLKLDEGRASVEVWVIERVERPTPN